MGLGCTCQLTVRRRRRGGEARRSHGLQTHSEIAIGTAALGQSLANVVHEVFLAAARGRADGLLLELDLRHDVWWRAARWAQWGGEVIRARVLVTAMRLLKRRGGMECCRSGARQQG